MKTAFVEYGDDKLQIAVPSDATILTPEDLRHDPPMVDPYEATRRALRNPLGMPALEDLVKPGDKVIICCPDRVKGGAHEKAHRKASIPVLVEALRKRVRLRDIELLISNGLHRKNTIEELRSYIGDVVVDLFLPDRLSCHDAEDMGNIENFGRDKMGNTVELNKKVAEADVAISIGHVLGNPYGGYSGGYKMVTTGITTWRSISCHHTPKVMHADDFIPANAESGMRRRMNSIGKAMERGMGKKFFCLDAVLGTDDQVLQVYAGDAEEVQRESWPIAQERTEVHLDIPEKFDILVFGEPRAFHYGPGHGTNPILMLQAIGAQLVRDYGVFKEDGVIICASLCDGWFNDEWFPAYRAVFEKLQNLSDFSDIVMFEEEICNNPDLIQKYRFAYGYGPFHPFSMIYCGAIALKHASKIFIVGAHEPDYARAMGCEPKKDFQDALKESEKYVDKDPNILVLSECFLKPGFNLLKK